jgi:uncharacterized protein (TIGR00255 family)
MATAESRATASSEATPATIRSMTGFALVRRETSAGELTLSLRTVNHRGLDLHFHMASELGPCENSLRTLLKEKIARGHVEIRASLARSSQDITTLNEPLLARYLELFRHAASSFGLDSKPDLNTFFGLPGVFETGRDGGAVDDNFVNEAVAAAEDCVRALNDFREREGAALVRSIEVEIDALEEQAGQIAAIRSEALEHFTSRLRHRLKDLLGDAPIAESRLIEEAAVLTDRSDVQEELTRLQVHTQELRRLLEKGGELGKRTDFLLQEMNRETNTILSKTSGVGEAGLTITNLGLAMKANIERMREQALNLE